jgi:hypothetical protein
MIKIALANELGLQCEKTIAKIGMYYGHDPTTNTTKVSFRISSLDDSSLDEAFIIPIC